MNKLQRAYHECQNEGFMLKEELGRVGRMLEESRGEGNVVRRELARKEEEMNS